jgi:hypothetical protein
MLKQSYLVCGAALLLAAVACSDSTGLNSGTISQADANQLATDFDGVASFGSNDFGPSASFSIVTDGTSGSAAVVSTPVPINTSFTVTKQCPRGGQVAFEGTVTGTGDRVAHNLTLDANATRTDTNCAFDTRDGVLTLSGNPNLSYSAHLNIVNFALSGLQTATHKGSFSWSRTGGSGTCDVDITRTFDPATKTLTIKGSFCGHNIDVTKTKNS